MRGKEVVSVHADERLKINGEDESSYPSIDYTRFIR